MAKATGKKRQGTRQETIPKGRAFMRKVSRKRIAEALKKERPGKPQIILNVCLLRKDGMGMRPIAREMGQKYSTVRGWLLRMMNADLRRIVDKKRGRKKQKMDADACGAIKRWLDNPPARYGFAEGTWQLDMVTAMLEGDLRIKCKPRMLRRMLKKMGFSYVKARPVPANSATPEKQLEFMDNASKTIKSLKAQGYAILCGDEAGILQWNSGGYGWRRIGGDDATKITYSKQSVKLFGALGEDGFYIRPTDELNSEAFIGYMKELQGIYHKFAIILDNAVYHKSSKVEKFIESTGGGIVPVFLPPHTPQRNPIEVQCRVLKRLLAGRYFETVDDLRDVIVKIIQDEMKPVKVMDYMA